MNIFIAYMESFQPFMVQLNEGHDNVNYRFLEVRAAAASTEHLETAATFNTVVKLRRHCTVIH